MKPLSVVWPYALVFWGVFLWSYIVEGRIVSRGMKKVRETQAQDANSLFVISFGGGLALLFAFAAAFLLPQFTIRRGHAAAFWIGIVVMIAGSLLRRHCFRMLGQYFTGNVQVLPDQRVVERGA